MEQKRILFLVNKNPLSKKEYSNFKKIEIEPFFLNTQKRRS